MVIVKSPNNQQDLGPAQISVENVQYWSHHTQQFAHSQVHKALEFVKNGCYEYVGEGMFLCNKINGYNTRTYNIKKNEITKEFACNCQKGREGDGMCSHVLGLYYAFKIGYFKNKGKEPEFNVEY